MGLTIARVRVKNPDTGASRELSLLVDTGSMLTRIDRSVLEELRVRPRRTRRLKTIEGRVIERRTGLVTLEMEGNEADVEVVFAEKGDAQVLGVIALESLGYMVNPITGRLEYVGYIAYRSSVDGKLNP